MMIDRDEAQKCYTQQDSNFNGLFTASQKIDGIYKISYARRTGLPIKKARLIPALPLGRPKKGGTMGWVVSSMTTHPLCGAMSVSPKELSLPDLRSDPYPQAAQVDDV
jgi:hypothetical protein